MANTVVQVVVSPFLEVLFDNLSSLFQNQVGLGWGVPKEMEKLSSTLSTIQNVLEDAEEKQFTNKAIGNWLRKLKDAAYDADDVLDECAFEGLQLASQTRQVTDSFLSCMSFKQNSLRRKIGIRIKEINGRFHEIAEERSKFHLREGIVERRVELGPNRETSSMITEPQVFGRDEDKESLVTLLLNNVNNQEDISICPIIGIGGLGKTTLAKMVYNDERVAEHFEVRPWVCVSDDYDVKRVIQSVLVNLSGIACDLDELDPLQRRLEEKLSGKRFLLVLDDVWNENQEEWNKLKYSLRSGAKGSSVVLTTRLNTVASITGTLPAYHLKVLSENDCWCLFKQRAFGLGNEERPDLVEIGKEIVRKCGGVPLAANALGGLMRFKSEEDEWLFVRDSDIWDLPQCNENNILPALRLSYYHLPSHLRQCFAYCAIFPKDYFITKDELLDLWIANGLVQSKGRMGLEKVGNEIFNELLWRSFLQDIQKNRYGNITGCKMHDLVHDLACSLMVNECSSVEVGKMGILDQRIRHLLLNSRSFLLSPTKIPPLLRTLLVKRAGELYEAPQLDLSDLKCLRFLDLSNAKIKTLPIPTRNLKHLRYLNLSYTSINVLPESICSLKELQVLNLNGCIYLIKLPKHMCKMRSLRQLCISRCYQITEMPIGISHLVHLQTLHNFIVGPKNGCRIKELQELDLRGELCVDGLEHVENLVEAREAKLIKKKNLCSLDFAWKIPCLPEHAAEVLEGLQPHPNIKAMSIVQYGGVIFPSWLGCSTLPKLQDLYLSDCARIKKLPPLGQLQSLKGLYMNAMSSLKSFGNELYSQGMTIGFPSLESISFSIMPELEEWFSSEENGREMTILPALKNLTIDGCPKLTKLQFPLSVERLILRNSNEMILRCFDSLPCLSSLEMSGFGELVTFPEGMLGNLTALHDLKIDRCSKLQSLPVELENLTALAHLKISECKELNYIPEGVQNLTSLWLTRCPNLESVRFLRRSSLIDLQIQQCANLISLSEGLQHQTSLERLLINGCTELEFLPEDFQQLTSLRKLDLCSLPKLTSLPEGLQHVTTLEHLQLHSCSGIKVLPHWIGSLTSLQFLWILDLMNLESIPEEMQCLTALRSLRIEGCSDQLERRCKEKGADWHKISHIPELFIESSSQRMQKEEYRDLYASTSASSCSSWSPCIKL